jgi:RNA polymerase sigma factor (sigma-70 family)
MRATSVNEAALVVAAQGGDQRALDELVAAYLPLVYNIVGRALSGHPDVDDIVQDTMVRALRDLRALRTPESFRLWLATIAVRQVGTHLDRRRAALWRTVPLDDAVDLPDSDADFEGLTILRLGLSGQRRQVARASRWLDPEDRALLSLWWLEAAGHLTRPELAGAMGITVTHAGVRIQRMTNQLEASRHLVAALEARRRCPGLAGVVADWDGRPSPLWRKRIARHVRSCPTCERAAEGLIPAARLLVGLALVPVPLALAATAKGVLSATVVSAVPSVSTYGAAIKVGLFSQLAHAVGAHPVVTAVVTVGALAAGAVAVVPWPSSEPPSSSTVVAQGPTRAAEPTPAAEPTRAATPTRVGPRPTTAAPSTPRPATVRLGPVSLESVDQAGSFVTLFGDFGVLTPIGAGQDRQAATFEAVPGLANAGCISLRTRDGRYLRHSMWRLRLSADEHTALFRGDATFCVHAGSVPGTVALESANYPGRYLRHVGGELWVHELDGSADFISSSSFRTR